MTHAAWGLCKNHHKSGMPQVAIVMVKTMLNHGMLEVYTPFSDQIHTRTKFSPSLLGCDGQSDRNGRFFLRKPSSGPEVQWDPRGRNSLEQSVWWLCCLQDFTVNLKKIESICSWKIQCSKKPKPQQQTSCNLFTCCQLSTFSTFAGCCHYSPTSHQNSIPPWNGQVAIDAHDWQSPGLEDLDIGSSSTTHVDNSRWMAQANRFRQEEMNETCSKDSVIVCIWPQDFPEYGNRMGNDEKPWGNHADAGIHGDTTCSSIFRHTHLNDEAERWIIANACISQVYQCTLYQTC